MTLKMRPHFTYDPYKSVETYADLLRLNVDYLNGNIRRTPYHGGPLDPETSALLASLVKLHEHAVLTVNSQPALRSEPRYIAKTWKHHGQTCGQWWVQTEQRPYVEAYLPVHLATAFRAYMSTTPQFYYAMYSFEERACWRWACAFGPPYSLRLTHTTFPSQRYTLTRERSHANPSQLEKTLWSPYSVWHGGIPLDQDFEGYPAIQEILATLTVKIIVVGKCFGDDSATQCLLAFLQHAHEFLR